MLLAASASVKVMGNDPAADVVPEIVAVPSPLSVNVKPEGSEPDYAYRYVGEPPNAWNVNE